MRALAGLACLLLLAGCSASNAGQEGASLASGEAVMSAEGQTFTSTDGRFIMTGAPGWEAYPAPLTDPVVLVVLRAEEIDGFASNITATWHEPAVTYEQWRDAVIATLETEPSQAPPVTVAGKDIDGLTLERTTGGAHIIQYAYPIITDDGILEVTASYRAEEDLAGDIVSMISSIRPAGDK
ncbi:MAG: hypothetical protein Q4P33_07510 [Flaviflexus sp.]|nr:hypothetical protein [Flaviflexus sp.]